MHPPPSSCLSQEVAAPDEDDVTYQPERGHASSPPRHRHQNTGNQSVAAAFVIGTYFFSLTSIELLCVCVCVNQMVHTFSGCVLGSAEECDLDELLATRLVSFLMDHQQSILSVPQYLLSAISDHVLYLRTVQVLP